MFARIPMPADVYWACIFVLTLIGIFHTMTVMFAAPDEKDDESDN